MGSRVMHYCIQSLLSERLDINDPQFFLGGIAPDANKPPGGPKIESHFLLTGADGIVKSDLRAFRQKYMSEQQLPFYLGYYCHLISDEVWVEDIYYPKIKYLPQPEKKRAQESYYRDFVRLNGMLIDHYGLVLQKLDVAPVDIDEIDYRMLPMLVDDLYGDFERKDETMDQQLELLTFDEVIVSLERSVAVCLEHMR
ncbi:hypothetical protein [Paenibacillus sp. YIM B09110]|uniref:hypothetical protein n=1 Tax=Paenibacillus sp. YIM B09110 TaxID=3126102 RepID=UPI00301C5738